MARSVLSGVAICYVLPVSWMTSCFKQWVLWYKMCRPISKRQNRNNLIYILHRVKLPNFAQRYKSAITQPGRSLLSVIALICVLSFVGVSLRPSPSPDQRAATEKLLPAMASQRAITSQLLPALTPAVAGQRAGRGAGYCLLLWAE